MSLYRISRFFCVAALLVLAACSEETTEAPKETEPLSGPRTPGLVGVFQVPEMLTLSILDSSDAKDIATHMAEKYTLLGEDAKAIGAELSSPSPGLINYNADPRNLKFECFLVLKNMPAKEPEHSKIVVLEAGNMLVYNYFGPYHNLISAYNEIRSYCAKSNLKQVGPVRELYLSEPEGEADSTQLLTRIILPVERISQ